LFHISFRSSPSVSSQSFTQMQTESNFYKLDVNLDENSGTFRANKFNNQNCPPQSNVAKSNISNSNHQGANGLSSISLTPPSSSFSSSSSSCSSTSSISIPTTASYFITQPTNHNQYSSSSSSMLNKLDNSSLFSPAIKTESSERFYVSNWLKNKIFS